MFRFTSFSLTPSPVAFAPRRVRTRYRFAALVVGLCLAGAASARAELPQLSTNQAYVEEVTRQDDLDVADVMAVFAFVLGKLPDRVKVYPTENYYYFKFHHRGVSYGGNIRLENGTRDQGQVHFAYGPETTDENDPGGHHKLLGSADGVAVEKINALSYRVSFRSKSVVFDLNDLSAVVPPQGMLAPDERYLGPVFDESAVRFFLVYNARLKLFHYLLDETVPVPDTLAQSRVSDRILIGRRTGFAFYRDARRERKILIGVMEANARANNYFDGPFDQLPDNFLNGEVLRDAILAIEPKLKGEIDRFGSKPDGETRYMIAPYLYYLSERELAVFDRCANAKRIAAERYYACFVIDEESSGDRPRTLAERPGRGGPERKAPHRRQRPPR